MPASNERNEGPALGARVLVPGTVIRNKGGVIRVQFCNGELGYFRPDQVRDAPAEQDEPDDGDQPKKAIQSPPFTRHIGRPRATK